MGLDELALLAEVVSGVFVVVSLVYLALQVRQSTRTQRTENYGRMLDRMSTLQSKISQDAELNRLFTVGAEDPARLTPSERIRFAWALYEMFGAGEFMFLQAREKALPEAVRQRWDATIVWWLSHPGMRAWWAAKPAPFAADFEAYCDDIIRNRRTDTAALGRWHGFVAGAGLKAQAAGRTEAPRTANPEGLPEFRVAPPA